MTQSTLIQSKFTTLLIEASNYMSASDLAPIVAAYDILTGGNNAQLSESFIAQSLDTATNLAQNWNSDNIILILSLLYYPIVFRNLTVENTRAKFGEKFGNVFYELIEALIKISDVFERDLPWNKLPSLYKLDERKKNVQYWENQNRATAAAAYLQLCRVPQIAILKITDRLHLLRWFDSLVSEYGEVSNNLKLKLANDTIELHGMVAEMLGVWSIKSELEDTAFNIVDFATYDQISRDLQENKVHRNEILQQAITEIKKLMNTNGIDAVVKGRTKHIYSIYLKMKATGKSVKDINDILGIRVIVKDDPDPKNIANTQKETAIPTNVQENKLDNRKHRKAREKKEAKRGETEESEKSLIEEIPTCTNCYEVFSLLVRNYDFAENVYPNGENHRDWIKKAKVNGYQSIHTTILFRGKPLEIQIRSNKMEDNAERGGAAHWIYKKIGNSLDLQGRLRDLVSDVTNFRKSLEDSPQ